MHNYKALKAASKASVQKVKVVDQAKVDEVKNDDGMVTTATIAEKSHEVLQVVCKKYDPNTGEAKDDYIEDYSLSDVKRQIDKCKADVITTEANQADWEQLETDLKAL